jgi:hypothetical protein
MFDTYKVAGLVAALFMVAPSARAAEPIPPAEQKQPARIVASPTTAVVQPAIPAGTPVPLDVGKFVWLTVENHSGPITFEFTAPGVVALLPEPPAGAVVSDHFAGIKQGESSPQWHKSPSKTAVPCLGVAEGFVKISAWGVDAGRAKKVAELTIQVGPRPPPDEIKPKPIDPDVKPKPPVTTNPFGNVAGLHVMMVYADNSPLPIGQHNAIYGAKVREYLNAKCGVGSDGSTKNYRIWPASTISSGDEKVWVDAFARKRESVPWIVIGNGAAGYEGPLPATVDETMALLKKYGDK